MLILVCYDISTVTKRGKKRLRAVARACENYGVRVQYSIFECILNDAQWALLREELLETMDPTTDSLRFYKLDKTSKEAIEHYGNRMPIDLDAPLIL